MQLLPRVGALVEGPAFYPFLSGTANLLRLDSANRSTTRGHPTRTGVRGAGSGRTQPCRRQEGARILAGDETAPRHRQHPPQAARTARPRRTDQWPDPQGTREVRSLVRSLAGDGTTVFVSSHLLAEVEQMCTHAAVMSAGNLVAQGTLDDLRRVGLSHVRVHTPDVAETRRVLSRFGLTPDQAGPPPGDREPRMANWSAPRWRSRSSNPRRSSPRW